MHLPARVWLLFYLRSLVPLDAVLLATTTTEADTSVQVKEARSLALTVLHTLDGSVLYGRIQLRL